MRLKQLGSLSFACCLLLTNNVARSGPARILPLDSALRAAESVIVMNVIAGRNIGNQRGAVYTIEISEVVSGLKVQASCLTGVRGLKVGGKYFALLRKSGKFDPKPSECGELVLMGGEEPVAFEIESGVSKDLFVRLDNRRIVYPKFDRVITTTQSYSSGGQEVKIVVGASVLYSEFRKHLINVISKKTGTK